MKKFRLWFIDANADCWQANTPAVRLTIEAKDYHAASRFAEAVARGMPTAGEDGDRITLDVEEL